jgi:hypothetical protein
MAKSLRSPLGSFISPTGERLNKQVLVRLSDGDADRLAALVGESSDRNDFIRAAIAEKLDRDSIQSRDLS